MDSVTHIVLGATLGEVLGGKRIGKKAMLIGAVAQSLPDSDFVAGLWMSPSHYFLAHRGFTHSFLFVALASLLLALLANYFRPTTMSFQRWSLFFFIQLMTHILLDSLNAYGVGWFEPFSHQRISFDVLFVADPFFTVWTSIACVVLLILRSSSPFRIRLAMIAIALSLVYILYAMNNKITISKAVEQSFKLQDIPAVEYLATPTPLNSWLWYVVVTRHDGYFIGYHSVYDSDTSAYHYIPKNDSLLQPHINEEETQQLIRVSRGYYNAEKHHDTLVFNNLRFGQINGWENPNAGFVFHYNLGRADNSLFTVQQGRFTGWNRNTLNTFLNRIKGN